MASRLLQTKDGRPMININGEEYIARPHEVDPELPEDSVWDTFPPNGLFISDPLWYDGLGQDLITQRRVWAMPTEEEQIEQFRQMLDEQPNRGLNMMYEAAWKGRPHIIRFLLAQGVHASAAEANGDDPDLVPIQAAAFQGHLECVKALLEEGGLGPNTRCHYGGTPLMRACWGGHPVIVRYLLEAGADINLRETKPEDNKPPMNAFEHAASSGCIECARMLVEHAEKLRLNISDFATRTAITAATFSDNLEMLFLVLELGNYPLLHPKVSQEYKSVALTEKMKSAIEEAFRVAFIHDNFKAMRALYAYLESCDENGEFIWTELETATTTCIQETLVILAGIDDEFSRETFTLFFQALFNPESRFSTNFSRDFSFLGDAYIQAAKQNSLEGLRLIESKYEGLDANCMMQNFGPLGITPLYTAAGHGHDEIVNHLFDQHGDLNVHLGVGKNVNGPTPIWRAVSDGQPSTVRLLLERGGGPLEYIDETIQTQKEVQKVVVSATAMHRCPVRLQSEINWRKSHGASTLSKASGTTTGDNFIETNYVVLEVKEEDADWLRKLQLRKSDEELMKMESAGRQLKKRPKDEHIE